MRKSPVISVIVPVYNRAPTIGRCLASILAQDCRDIEVIVVDDGSTDAGTGICRAFAALDSRVVLLRQANRGVAAARNAGLARASAEYVTFVDSDDYLDTGTVSVFLPHLAPGRIVAAGYRVLRAGQPDWIWEELLNEGLVDREVALTMLYRDDSFRNYLWNKVFPRALFDGIRFPEGLVYEDIDVMWRLFEAASEVMLLPRCGYNYVLRPGSITSDSALWKSLDCAEIHIERFEKARIRTPEIERLLARSVALACMELPVFALLHPCKRHAWRVRRETVNSRLLGLQQSLAPWLTPRQRFALKLVSHGTLAADIAVAVLRAANNGRRVLRDRLLDLGKTLGGWKSCEGLGDGRRP